MKSTISTLNLLALLSFGGALLGPDVARALPAEPVSGEAQLAQASQTATITGLTIDETETGLEIRVETAGGTLAGPDASRTAGNALILEVPNAILSESEFSDFDTFEPIEGIALIQVSALEGDRVQISITGADAPPVAEAIADGTGLSLSVTLGEPGSGDTDDAIQLSITGEDDDYFVPDATTATRIDTPLRDIPQSIQVIPRQVFEDQGAVRLNQALRNASGVVSSENEPRGQRFNIRGFSSSSVLRDGIRLTNGATGNIGFQELANIEQIEVLKGPASILFGVVEPGGVVNLVSEQPLGVPRYEVGFRAGNREFLEPNLDFTGPLTRDGSVRYRVNALYRTEEYYRDYNDPVERFFIAPVVAIDIDDDTDLTLELEYRDDRRPNDFGLFVLDGQDEVIDVPLDRALSNPNDLSTSEALRLGYRLEHRFDDRWKLRNSLHYSRYDSTILTNLAGTLVSFGAIPFVIDPDTGDSFIFSGRLSQLSSALELQTNVVGEFNTGAIEHTLLAGVDFFQYWNRGNEIRAEFPPIGDPDALNFFNPDYSTLPDIDNSDFDDLPVVFDGSGRTDGLGIYIQDQVKLADNLILLAGLRFDTVYQENNDFNVLSGTTETDREESDVTPRAGIVYQPSDDLSLYASYSRSFAPNNSTTVDGNFLEAERGEQFEVGARLELLDDNLLINLALFDLEKDNVAIVDPDNVLFFVAGGKQRSRGIELDIIGEILPGWNIVANYAYLDTELVDDDDPNQGNELFSAPESVANLWTTYQFQSGTLEGLLLGVGFNYVGDRFGDLENSFSVDDYFLTNAVIGYESDNWQAMLNFSNIFDIDYIESVAGTRFQEIYPGEGFTAIGSLSIQF
ncbi:MAG: TonB-dependent siderophore receptor [Geitlerinemataceae cyanobacterium]